MKDEKIQTYVCVRPCWHEKHLYQPGDVIKTFNPDKALPHDKKGNIRHFVPADEFTEEVVSDVAMQDRKDAKSKGAKLNPQKAGDAAKSEEPQVETPQEPAESSKKPKK